MKNWFGMQRICLLALGSAAALYGAASAANSFKGPADSGFQFHIVTGDDTAVTRRIAADLYQRLVPVFSGFRTELAQQRRMVYLAIGPVALREVSTRKCDCVVIAAYTSSQIWRSITADLPRSRLLNMTAVYAEPAPSDQLQLVSLLYKRPVRVAAILSDDTLFLKPTLHGVSEIETYVPGADINEALNRIGQSKILLAMPDRSVYNAENFRNILLSTYRHNQAVIGFSADMVGAGALASTYSDIEHVNEQLAETAGAFVATGTLAPPRFPRYFRTIINEGVAGSLEVRVDDAARNFGRAPPVKRP